MKKFVIILLTIISFINFNNGVFASSKGGSVYHGMRKGFGFLVKTRDESVLNPETIRERRRIENLIVGTYREGNRDLLIQAYNEEVEGFKNLNNEFKRKTGQNDRPCLECLMELRRIKALMISGKK